MQWSKEALEELLHFQNQQEKKYGLKQSKRLKSEFIQIYIKTMKNKENNDNEKVENRDSTKQGNQDIINKIIDRHKKP
jgi:hypothetical protein